MFSTVGGGSKGSPEKSTLSLGWYLRGNQEEALFFDKHTTLRATSKKYTVYQPWFTNHVGGASFRASLDTVDSTSHQWVVSEFLNMGFP